MTFTIISLICIFILGYIIGSFKSSLSSKGSQAAKEIIMKYSEHRYECAINTTEVKTVDDLKELEKKCNCGLFQLIEAIEGK